MTEPLLQVTDLHVVYHRGRNAVNAVNRVSLELAPGETLGLVGESGSGKSSLANAIVGLAPVTDGGIRFDGQDVTRLRFAQRRAFYRRVQVIFQDPYSSLNPARTVGATLTESLQVDSRRERTSTAARVRAMLERVGLPAEAATRYPSEFSGGQRQRIAIARALMPSPQLVICDEPTSALDLTVQAQVLNLLQDLQATERLSYLFVSHDLEVIRHMCDRVVVLYRGEVMETGPAQHVFDRPSHPYTLALQRSVPVPDPQEQRLRREQRRDPARIQADATDTGAAACPFATRCAFAIPRCFDERPQLRPAHDGEGDVACHRFPDWRAEAAAGRNPPAAPVSTPAHASESTLTSTDKATR
jgi:peptide/nickel transport system ATP-binding protein